MGIMGISVLGRFFGHGSGFTIRLSSIDIKFMGSVHAMPGITSTKNVFDINIPFKNKMGSGMLPENIKGPDVTLKGIKVSSPFKVIRIEPSLPIKVGYMSREEIRLTIEGPRMNYDGPIAIDFGNDTSEEVTLNISRYTLEFPGRKSDLENTATVMKIQKGQVFRKDVQFYKVGSYMSKVNSITINEPFELVSTQPKAPFVASAKDSFIVSVFIKAPEFNYSGDVRICFS
jgi:hypothetical protein